MDLVAVAMNAAPPDSFQPNVTSSVAASDRSLPASHQSVPSSSRPSTLHASSPGARGGLSAASSGRAAGHGSSTPTAAADPNFDVDLFDHEGHAAAPPSTSHLPQQHQQQPTSAASAPNQAPDDFFDFDF